MRIAIGWRAIQSFFERAFKTAGAAIVSLAGLGICALVVGFAMVHIHDSYMVRVHKGYVAEPDGLSAVLLGALEWTGGFLLHHVAGVLITGAIVAFLLSRRDLQKSLVEIVYSLLFQGQILVYFTDRRLRRLKRLIVTRQLPRGAKLDRSLYAHDESGCRKALSSPHAHSYSASLKLSPIAGYAELLLEETSMSYTLSTAHLSDAAFSHNVELLFSIPVPAEYTAEMPGPVLSFRAMIGNKEYTLADFAVTKHRHCDTDSLEYRLSKPVNIVKSIDVRYMFSAVRLGSDTAENIYARYPTKAFRASVEVPEGNVFQYAGFSHQPGDGLADLPLDKCFEGNDRQLEMVYSGWLMPGEGVSFSWSKKLDTAISPTKFVAALAEARKRVNKTVHLPVIAPPPP